MNNKLISKKKVPFPVTPSLQAYLDAHGRSIEIPVAYDDLLRFEGSVPILDGNDEDTLWVDCLYSMSDRDELVLNLQRVYSILHADGSDTILPFITVDSIACMQDQPLSAEGKIAELKQDLHALRSLLHDSKALHQIDFAGFIAVTVDPATMGQRRLSEAVKSLMSAWGAFSVENQGANESDIPPHLTPLARLCVRGRHGY